MVIVSPDDEKSFVKRTVLPARIDANAAARAFWRARASNLFGLLRARPVRRAPDGLPASLELVWMPAYAFRMSLSRGRARSHVWVCVDASFGGFALFERQDALEDREVAGETFAPVLDVGGAEALAREGFLRYILRRRGAKPVIEAVEETILYHAPVWVYYFRAFGNKIDLAVRDAYSGDPMGGQVRIAVLNAFIRKRSSADERGETPTD